MSTYLSRDITSSTWETKWRNASSPVPDSATSPPSSRQRLFWSACECTSEMLRFAKAHAYGNDFLYVDRGGVNGVNLSQLAREMCERHTGLGADGLIVYGRTAPGATMELFNAD